MSRFPIFYDFYRFRPFYRSRLIKNYRPCSGLCQVFFNCTNPFFLYPHAKNQLNIPPLQVFRGGCDSSSMLMSHGARSKKLRKPLIGGQVQLTLGGPQWPGHASCPLGPSLAEPCCCPCPHTTAYVPTCGGHHRGLHLSFCHVQRCWRGLARRFRSLDGACLGVVVR